MSAEAGEPRRSGRKRRATTVTVGSYSIKLNNQYTLEEGERSVYESELNPDFAAAELKAAVRPARRPAKKGPPTSTAPRQQSAAEKARLEQNALVGIIQGELAERRVAFMNHHLDVIRPWITRKDLSALQGASQGNLPAVQTLEQQPSVIQANMREYQLLGTRFMAKMAGEGVGCILADEMGLGKTLQSIALIAYLKKELQQPGPCLVVVPLSVLSSWSAEFKKWCPCLKIERAHTSDQKYYDQLAKRITAVGPDSPDVVITTYDMIKAMSQLTTRLMWRLLILDEGHLVKNEQSERAIALRKVRAASKVILTGTPLQNNLKELWALLSFLNPIFSDPEPFERAFQLGTHEHSSDAGALDDARRLLHLFCLRRTKREVEVSLPPLIETRVECPLSKLQTFWYRRLLLRDTAVLAKVEKEDADGEQAEAGGSSWMKLRSLFMQLRKCCNHPYLFPDAEPNYDGSTDERLVEASGKLGVLDRLLRKLDAGGHRVVLFSQFTTMLDILEDLLVLRGYEGRYSRLDGSVARAQRTVDIAEFNRKNNENKMFCFLLSTRAGGLGVNLQTADTVILFDSDWNPQVDMQAIARVHRIGQKKAVAALRLMTSASVEQRIVERAEKKLYLDAVVGRGSTSESQDLDKKEEDGASKRDLLNALVFGADQIFRNDSGRTPTDSELDALLVSARHPDKGLEHGSVVTGLATEAKPADEPSRGVTEVLTAAKKTAADFDPTVSYSVESSEGLKLRMLGELLQEEALKRGETTYSVSKMTFSEMAKEAAREVEYVASPEKRSRQSNLQAVTDQWGKVHHVLRQNMYDMDTGEPSVFMREKDAGFQDRCAVEKRKYQIPGSSYEWSMNCQSCWMDATGPDAVRCTGCPCAMHLSCLQAGGYNEPPTQKSQARMWRCPHHTCVQCGLAAQASGGLLFRCECCMLAFCEDHLPVQAEDEDDPHSEGWAAVGRCRRFESYGLKHQAQAYFITCSAACREWKENNSDIFDPTSSDDEGDEDADAHMQSPPMERRKASPQLAKKHTPIDIKSAFTGIDAGTHVTAKKIDNMFVDLS
ncbi:hypothetical protein CYMTET_17438 [Cymbomonas tetramitiformis]|uniref:Uncharacterized protein n=1 Tax=Cymbomonas tetramitiformis TaxID=36881 RepID=A0AAE0GA56_9CHLO|nr:hypothetical protein CYMTET_17438 [Cymbomonas tetramitiformis]